MNACCNSPLQVVVSVLFVAACRQGGWRDQFEGVDGVKEGPLQQWDSVCYSCILAFFPGSDCVVNFGESYAVE